MATKKNPNQIEHFLSLDLENINSLKMPMLKAIILFLLLSNCLFAFTQKIVSSKIKENLVQDLKGIVIDRVLQTPISGATITLLPEGRTIVSDSNGNFNLKQVPIGVHQLLVSHIEYTDVLLDNININVGKATVVNVAMDMNIRKNEPVVIKAISRRNKPLNDMSIVSTRAFTVEETQRYAAAVNDPSRMAQGFPGVMVLQDANNDIIIRGNSPTGLLWRMEGVDIPNPNHFASAGSSGGGISILSSQLMANSDFLTGAFAAEYGDALSGVFDIKLRKGNNEKNEYTFQAGLIGLNLSAEGPFNSSYTGSYLINYRYSTLEILNRIGIHLNEGNTNFQDLSYNIYLPTSKSGIFTFFGFGGLSSKAQLPLLDSTQWISEGKRYSSANYSNTGASGITHKLILSNNTSLASAIAYSYNNLDSKELYVERDYTLTNKYRDSYKTSKLTITSTLNHKFSSRSSLRMGSTVSLMGFDYYLDAPDVQNGPLVEMINSRDNTQTIQAFAEWQFKTFGHFTFNIGGHYLQLAYNHSYSIEPRVSLKYDFKTSNIAFAYGEHSQIQGLGTYFAQVKNSNGNIEYVNHDLNFTKARHFVLSVQHSFTDNMGLKAELYDQELYNVPISLTDSTFSILNVEKDYVTEALVNQGKGRNYGLEISLEKHLSNYLYYMISGSWYQSKFTAADGIERNTRFNGNYLYNLVAGKDFPTKNKLKTFGVNVKVIYSGGLRSIPVDLQKSIQQGYTILDKKDEYTLQNPPYFRPDLRLNYTWNKKHHTSTLSLDIQNLINRKNAELPFFIAEKKIVVYSNQNGIIPVLNYKIDF